jgi:hypothetical protein
MLAQADAYIGIHGELASWLRLSVPILDPVVKNREEIQRSFVQCGPSSKRRKPLKCLPLEEVASELAA